MENAKYFDVLVVENEKGPFVFNFHVPSMFFKSHPESQSFSSIL